MVVEDQVGEVLLLVGVPRHVTRHVRGRHPANRDKNESITYLGTWNVQ